MQARWSFQGTCHVHKVSYQALAMQTRWSSALGSGNTFKSKNLPGIVAGGYQMEFWKVVLRNTNMFFPQVGWETDAWTVWGGASLLLDELPGWSDWSYHRCLHLLSMTYSHCLYVQIDHISPLLHCSDQSYHHCLKAQINHITVAFISLPSVWSSNLILIFWFSVPQEPCANATTICKNQVFLNLSLFAFNFIFHMSICTFS